MKRLATRESVLQAVAEFDRLGRDRFLQTYGFRRSKSYLLRLNGREYDSKAIVAVAHGFEDSSVGPLRSDELSGGVGGGGAVAQLRALGFEVAGLESTGAPNPPSSVPQSRSASIRMPVRQVAGTVESGSKTVSGGPKADTIDAGNVVSQLLTAVRRSPEEYARDPHLVSEAGLYAWFADDTGQRLVEDALGVPVGSLLYVGQAGATRWPSGTRSNATLGVRIGRQHYGGNTRSSTVRRTFAAALGPALGLRFREGGLDRDGEESVREFMRDHLRVAAVPLSDRDGLGELEAAVVRLLDPPLNLDHVPKTKARRRLSALRSAMTAAP